MEKNIQELEAKKLSLQKEVDDLIDNLTDESTDEDLKEVDDKTEEVKSLNSKIAKIKKIAELKKAQKAQEAIEDSEAEEDNDSDEEEKEDEILEEKEKSMNSFNINKGIIPAGLGNNRNYIGRKALNEFLIKQFGADGAKSLIKNDIGSKAADYVIKSALTSVNQPVVPQDMAGFISLLTAEAVVRPNARIINTQFGNRTIARMRLGASATWQGEGEVYTPSSQDFDQINLGWYKLAAMTYTTLEFNNFSYMDLTSEITDNLAQMVALTEDQTFLLGSTATYAPKTSLLNSAKNTFTSTGLTNVEIANDLANVKSRMESDFISVDGAVVFGAPAVFNALENLATSFGVYPFRDEIRSGYLNGFKIVKSAQIPTNEATGSGDTAATNGSPLIFAQPKHLIIGDSYKYNLRSTMDGSFMDGGTLVNTFGQDLIAWKLANSVDFAVEHPEAVCVLNTVGWTTLNIAGQNQAVSPANTSSTSASGAKGKTA